MGPKTDENNNELNDSVEIRDTDGKHFGLFACENFKRGQMILSEEPFIKVLENNFKDAEIDEYAKLLLETFTDSFFPNDDERTFVGVMRTNMLPLGKRSKNFGIFENISRINHSCLPNVCHFWDKETQREQIFCLRDIKKDEEILTSYCDLYADKETRRQTLKKGFNFECECVLCSMVGDDQKKSDIRRRILKKLDEEIPALATSRQIPEALEKVDQLIKVLDEENMSYDATYLGRISYDAFSINWQTKQDTDKQAYWANKVKENFTVSKGGLKDAVLGEEIEKLLT